MFNCYVMNKNEKVAYINNDEITILNDRLCPYYLLHTKNFELWLQSRCFDETRTNMRNIKKHFNITLEKDVDIIYKMHAVSITDTFWVKTIDEENLSYEEIIFSDNSLFKAALLGEAISPDTRPSINSPEFTNIGSLEKGWNLINDSWILFKKECKNEIFNELFSEKISNFLGIPSAHYYAESQLSNVIASVDFTSNGKYQLEHVSCILDDVSDYLITYNKINSFAGKTIADQYAQLMYFDAVVRNTDRHNYNFGFLRDCSSGELISLAPNFDYNQTLFGVDTIPENPIAKTDILINDFVELLLTVKPNFTIKEYTISDIYNCTQELSDYPGYDGAVKLISERMAIIYKSLSEN